jgi:hypothetical protein
LVAGAITAARKLQETLRRLAATTAEQAAAELPSASAAMAALEDEFGAAAAVLASPNIAMLR